MENIKRVEYNTLTFIHLYLAATKVNGEFASENGMKFRGFSKTHKFSSCFLSPFKQSSNSTSKFSKN